MKLTKGKAILIATGTALVLAISACSGKYCRTTPEEHAQWLVEKATDKLELTQAQQDKFRVFTQQLLKAHQELKPEKEQTHKLILGMLEQPKLDRNKALNRFNRHMDSLKSQAPAVVNSFGDFYDTLSEQQRRELRDKIEHHFEHHHHRSHW